MGELTDTDTLMFTDTTARGPLIPSPRLMLMPTMVSMAMDWVTTDWDTEPTADADAYYGYYGYARPYGYGYRYGGYRGYYYGKVLRTRSTKQKLKANITPCYLT